MLKSITFYIFCADIFVTFGRQNQKIKHSWCPFRSFQSFRSTFWMAKGHRLYCYCYCYCYRPVSWESVILLLEIIVHWRYCNLTVCYFGLSISQDYFVIAKFDRLFADVFWYTLEPRSKAPRVRQTRQYGMGFKSPNFISFNLSYCKFRQ